MNNTKMIAPYILNSLNELRRRMLKVLFLFLLFALVFSLFAKSLFTVLAFPLLKTLVSPQQLIATQLTAPLFIPLKFAFYCAAFISFPYFFYQCWFFVTPALYRQEKSYFILFLGGGISFFIMGVIVAYFFILPHLLRFMLLASPPQLTVMPDLSLYFDFVMTVLWSFGLAFELPLIMQFLVLFQLLSVSQFKKARRFIIIVIFIVAMFIAPDILSQCFLALPLYSLYELGILMSRYLVPRPETTAPRSTQ